MQMQKHSLLLQVVLPARPRLTAGVRTFECLDPGVDPLVTLKMTPSGKGPLASLTHMRLALTLRRPCRAILALSWCLRVCDGRLDVAKGRLCCVGKVGRAR
jgi:hypothetical protein